MHIEIHLNLIIGIWNIITVVRKLGPSTSFLEAFHTSPHKQILFTPSCLSESVAIIPRAYSSHLVFYCSHPYEVPIMGSFTIVDWATFYNSLWLIIQTAIKKKQIPYFIFSWKTVSVMQKIMAKYFIEFWNSAKLL